MSFLGRACLWRWGRVRGDGGLGEGQHHPGLTHGPGLAHASAVCYPKRTDKPLYHGLVTQCESLGDSQFVPPEEILEARGKACGSGTTWCWTPFLDSASREKPRPPFDSLLHLLRPSANSSPAGGIGTIPSGWDVEKGT
eukprot:jgi/Botrbrau1/15276/Bobra.97_1s0002.1